MGVSIYNAVDTLSFEKFADCIYLFSFFQVSSHDNSHTGRSIAVWLHSI